MSQAAYGSPQNVRSVAVLGKRGRLGDLMMQSLKRREPTIEPTRLNSERDKSMRAPLIIRLNSVSGLVLYGFSGRNKRISPRSLSSEFSNFRFCPI
jgi:hypothetical protein